MGRTMKRLEKQITRRDRALAARTTLLTNMSHDLRTPLNGIIGFAELIHDERVGPLSAEQKEYMGDILASSRQLLQLIDDLLDRSSRRCERARWAHRREDGMAHDPILIVDDNASNRKLMHVLLTGAGYDVRTAADARAVLTALSTFTPRLILMDIQLPGMDGLELARRLKRDAATRSIRILALTGYAMREGDAEALGAGCDGDIVKPIDTRTLLATVAGYLGGMDPR